MLLVWITTTGDIKPVTNHNCTIFVYMVHRNNYLFWTDVYYDIVFIWRSNLDDGSHAIPLIDTGASPTQHGKTITY